MNQMVQAVPLTFNNYLEKMYRQSFVAFPQEKLRVALYVQKAALQFIDGMYTV
jgi:hypothetical protein